MTIAPAVSQGSLSDDRRTYAQIPEVLEVPNLIQVQLNSFKWLTEHGIKELFEEVSPISDFTGGRYELHFKDYEFRTPKYTEDECRDRDKTFAAPLFVRVVLVKKAGEGAGEEVEQQVFMGDMPMMTSDGTFIINGAERVVVSQLVRSPGVYFTITEDAGSGRRLCAAKLIPNRGAWLEFDTSARDVLSVKVDRKRKIPVTTLLRALGFGEDDALYDLMKDVDKDPEHHYTRATIEKEPGVRNEDEALLDLYRKLRPGEPPSLDNARALLNTLFFNFRRYDLGKVGRYKLNGRLKLKTDQSQRVLTEGDLVAIVRQMIRINNGEDQGDDIDHLGNRRVRAVGELTVNQLRVGLLRMERVVKERMTLIDPEQATPGALINIRPIVAAVKEFFGGSQLSQFMDQTNPLAELTHKRRLSALGPGGLSRERAGFDVRDVHHSHYGQNLSHRDPRGPEHRTPRVPRDLRPDQRVRLHRDPLPARPERRRQQTLGARWQDHPRAHHQQHGQGHRRCRRGHRREDRKEAQGPQGPPNQGQVLRLVRHRIPVRRPRGAVYDRPGQRGPGRPHAVPRREDRGAPRTRFRHGVPFEHVDFMDVSPKQIVSVSTSLIPFLEHDDANRALMGANMQRQAVPLLRPEAPLVGTGMEGRVARDSGQVLLSGLDGVVSQVSANGITVRAKDGTEEHHRLNKFVRSNQGTCMNQRPIVRKGDLVARGAPLADSSSTEGGELALGQNILCAFMSWEGYNFEDAIIISERLVREDQLTSIHIEKQEVEARDTKLGPEEITRDIPNVGDESLRDLDERGIIRVGAQVGPGDILVGKITPKGETELTAEEKLLRAIFGEKAREVKDTSLRVPHGERGKVTDVRVFSQEDRDELSPGVNRMVRVWIAQTRKVAEGDKMAGRHGNKGVIARIMPQEDMPFLPDGTPVDIILNPIGVPSRMNLGQVLETHLGWAAKSLNFMASTPVFDGADDTAVQDGLARTWLMERVSSLINGHGPMEAAANWLTERGEDPSKVFSDEFPGEASRACLRIWLEEDAGISAKGMDLEKLAAEAQRLHQKEQLAPPIFGKTVLHDGRTGDKFDQPVTVGYIYMMKLIHLVEDKIHARSTGPYSLITQQPLGGKAQFGGQRFGEMEVWALEAYSAAYNLQEMLTVKSDDVVGRVKTYEAIVKGEDVSQPGVPESFHVLLKELQSLGLAVELLNEEEERVSLLDELTADMLDEEGGFEGLPPIDPEVQATQDGVEVSTVEESS